MYLASFNVQNNPNLSREKVRKCGAFLGSNCVLAGLQEIAEDNDVEDIMRGLGTGWDIINHSTHEPIVFHTGVLRLASGRELPPGFHHRGILMLNRGDSSIPVPSHYASWGIFKSVKQPNLPPFAHVNFHLINKAWNGKEHNANIRRRRQEIWHDGFDEAQWLVNNFRKHGLTTTWTADYNRAYRSTPQFNPRQRTVAEHNIDQIHIARGRGSKACGFNVYEDKAKVIDTPSDHKLLVGNIQLLVP